MIKSKKLIYGEVIIALILFVLTLLNMDLSHMKIGFITVIGLLLYFMIYVELIRAIADFIFDSDHKFKVRYIYDMGIIFIIRELLVTLTANHHHIEKELIFIGISIVVLIVLFVLRIYDAKTFKYLNNCDTCIHSYNSKD